mgnify:CR=1 FL=1
MEDLVVRYAAAIVSIARDEQKIEQYKFAVLDVQEKLSNEPKLLKLLTSYFVDNEKKMLVIDELCSSYKLDNFTNFLKLLTKKHKISMFKDIAKKINSELNDSLNIFEGFIYSTEKLSEEKISEIEDVISTRMKRKVELKNKIDKRLIGGVKVVVHDHVFDGSIKYKLETMKQNLKERRTTDEN